MVDWTSSMQQYFEYYTVDPGTWHDMKKLSCITSCSINRDSETDTLGSATFDTTELFGECYIRVYLVTVQNGVTERHPLGTFLAQTPNTSFDGKIRSISIDAYTPLIELKENEPELGSFIPKYNKDTNPYTILDEAYFKTKDHARAPVVRRSVPTTPMYTLHDDFVSETGKTWLVYIRELLQEANHTFMLDEQGRISFSPIYDIDTQSPIWTFDDGNSSILYPDVSINHDIFDIPNIVEVTYSTPFNGVLIATKINDDPNSPVSTISRGRDIVRRVTNPSGLSAYALNSEVDEYAENLLKSLSTLRCSVTYTHGYCPVRLDDCVRLNYANAGLNNIKARVINQSIRCTPGCKVQEKAIFNVKLWR